MEDVHNLKPSTKGKLSSLATAAMNSTPQNIMNNSKAVSLNNGGAFYLLNKDYAQAIALFRNSVRVTKELLGHARRLEMNQRSLLPDFRFEFRDAGNFQHQTTDQSQNTPDDSFVSRSVVVITQSDPMDVSVLCLYKISMITVYNLALASHLSGLQSRCMKRLKRALEYYEISYKLQMQEPLSQKPTHVLSILNNVGAIYRLLHEHEKSNMFFRHLLSKMTHLKETGSVEENLDRWNGFWSNIIGLVAYV